MVRIILVCAVAWILLRLVYRLFSGSPQTDVRAQDKQASKMVRCACCDLYTVQDDAIRGPDNKYYCSEEHREAAMINKDG